MVPAAMRRKTAAAYLDMSEGAFVREVSAGRLPCGFMLGGREHWRKDALDRAITVLSGERDDSAEAEFWNRGQAA